MFMYVYATPDIFHEAKFDYSLHKVVGGIRGGSYQQSYYIRFWL